LRGFVTILFSTHHPEEAAAVCDEIMILNKGQVVVWGNPAEITARAVGRVFEASISLQRLPLETEWRLVSAERDGEYLHLRTVGSSPPDGRSVPPRLTDAYLLLTSEPERND
jgi:ABC-2 type transport system ATP-binding protein